MPLDAIGGFRGIDPAGRPDFVLGDRYGTSCSADLTETAASILKSLGYTVARNKPYAGGFITEHYGRPSKGLHALQIEINRGVYMNEDTFEKSDGFEAAVARPDDFHPGNRGQQMRQSAAAPACRRITSRPNP